MAHDLFDLTGKFALITGSTKGIGRAIAEAFVDHGATVAITGRVAADAEAVAAEINARALRDCAIGVAANMHDRASLLAAHDAAVERFGRIDVCVCNAAVLPESFGPALDHEADDFLEMVEGNMVNTAALMVHAARPMKARRDGVILVTTSSSGIYPSFGTLPYGASKAGLAFFVRGLAAELAPSNVRVNAVAPGLTRSYSMEQQEKLNPAAMDGFRQGVPLRRIIECREIAAAMVFLASEAGKGATGIEIPIMGGEPGNGGPPDH